MKEIHIIYILTGINFTLTIMIWALNDQAIKLHRAIYNGIAEEISK